jgi:hypothetical protein
VAGVAARTRADPAPVLACRHTGQSLECRCAAGRCRRGPGIEAVADTNLRRAAAAVAVAGVALLGGLPLLIEPELSPLEGGLALVPSLTALVALIFAPLLLPPAIALYGAEFVLLVHRGELALWNIPLLAVGLLLVYEAGELRHRLPPGSLIEAAPLRVLTRQIAATAALGLLGSAAVVAAASLSSRGGAAAAVVGGLAVAVAVLLVRMLAPTAQIDDAG